ncbi:hypothetical protein BGW39_010283 [Mortierella sp. 14UC]|nr:hypothetical protein BGW39_010283 [Mortierella sp. 14UC]
MSRDNVDLTLTLLVVPNGHNDSNAVLVVVPRSSTVGELKGLIRDAFAEHPKFKDYFDCFKMRIWRIFLPPAPLYKEILGIDHSVVCRDKSKIKARLGSDEIVGEVLDEAVYPMSWGKMFVAAERYD